MRLPIVTIVISLLSSALYIVFGSMPESLIWHQGDNLKAWQWLSAHFAHISVEHLAWNIGALMVLGSIIEQTSRKVLGLTILFGIIGVNIYLASFYSLDAYAGLSGMLNALLMLALYFLYQQPDYKVASVITLALSLAKIAIEHFYHLSLFSELPWPSVPQAHLAGLLAGSFIVFVLEWRRKTLLKSDLITFDDLPPLRQQDCLSTNYLPIPTR